MKITYSEAMYRLIDYATDTYTPDEVRPQINSAINKLLARHRQGKLNRTDIDEAAELLWHSGWL